MVTLQSVSLGNTGVCISVAGLGGGSASRFGLARGGTSRDVRRLVDQALELGITLFDSSGAVAGTDAPLAEAIGLRRHNVVISTKVHIGPYVPDLPPGNSRILNRLSARLAAETGLLASPNTVRLRVEKALRELQSDYIDILSLHGVPPERYYLVHDRLLPVLLRLKEEGKVRAVGITENVTADPGHRMLDMALNSEAFDTIMVAVGPLRQQALARLLPKAKAANVGVIAMYAARDGCASEARLARWMRGRFGISEAEAAARAHDIVVQLCAQGFPGPASAAYRFTLDLDTVDAVLIGTTRPDHLKDNVAVLLAGGPGHVNWDSLIPRLHHNGI